jgi:hypothetical protein
MVEMWAGKRGEPLKIGEVDFSRLTKSYSFLILANGRLKSEEKRRLKEIQNADRYKSP